MPTVALGFQIQSGRGHERSHQANSKALVASGCKNAVNFPSIDAVAVMDVTPQRSGSARSDSDAKD
jgi:hypothetical protein